MAKPTRDKSTPKAPATAHAGARGSQTGARGSQAGARGSQAGADRPQAGARGPHAGDAIDLAGALDAIEVPTFPPVALTPPRRRERRLMHPGPSIARARQRLVLAYQLRAALEPALPGGAAFFPRAFTALDVLQHRHEATSGTAARDAALTTLHDAVMRVRTIVADTAPVGDPARAALHFETPLHADAALVAIAPAILAGARSVRAEFPALTDALLATAEHALTAAKHAAAAATRAQDAAHVAHATHADDAQLALDVLLDALDHLRAAARSQLETTRPLVAAHFIAPLEHGHHAEAATAPASPPVGAPAGAPAA